MKKFFTLLIVFLPIFSQYKSPINKLDLGTFMICAIAPFVLFKMKKIKLSRGNKKIKIILLLLCFYILLSTSLACILQNQINYFNIIVRTIKFVFLTVFIICIAYEYLFDFNFGIKALRNVTLLSSVYIIIQTISFYVLKIVLPGIIEPIIQQGEYFNLTYEYATNLVLYRPTSFFLEPSMFSEYVILYLTYVLFNDNVKTKSEYVQAIIISIGIICSTSGLGYLFCTIIWGTFFYKRFIKKTKKNDLLIIMIMIIIGIIMIPKILNIPIIHKAMQRGIDGSETGGNAFIGRIKSFSYFNDLDTKYKIIGMGYGNPIEGKFMNSMSYIMYCCGTLGMIMISYLFFNLFRFKSDNKSKNIFVFIWIISLFFTTSFVATKICFYLSFLIIEKNNKEILNT